MKPVATLTFSTFADYKTVRDHIESQENQEALKWKYGASDGKSFIQFFNGTSATFFLSLGITLSGMKLGEYVIS